MYKRDVRLYLADIDFTLGHKNRQNLSTIPETLKMI